MNLDFHAAAGSLGASVAEVLEHGRGRWEMSSDPCIQVGFRTVPSWRLEREWEDDSQQLALGDARVGFETGHLPGGITWQNQVEPAVKGRSACTAPETGFQETLSPSNMGRRGRTHEQMPRKSSSFAS